MCSRTSIALVFCDDVSCQTLLLLVFLFVFIWAILGPIDTVSQWFATNSKYWEWPQPFVASKDLLPILVRIDIVETLVGLSFHFQILYRRLIRQGQLEMELEEHRNQNGYDPIQHESDLNHDFGEKNCLRSILRSEIIRIERPLDTLKPGDRHRDHYKVGEDQHVNE